MSRHRLHTVAALLAVVALAGCGGGGGTAAPALADPLASVPDSAQVDAAGLVTYLELLADNRSEMHEPADLATVMLTKRDDTEPMALK